MIIEDFSFYATSYYSRNRQKSLKIRLISTLLITVCFRNVSEKTAIKMLTIKTEVRKEEKRKDGTFKVRIRITQNRKIKRLPTKLFAKKSDLNKSFELKEGHSVKWPRR